MKDMWKKGGERNWNICRLKEKIRKMAGREEGRGRKIARREEGR